MNTETTYVLKFKDEAAFVVLGALEAERDKAEEYIKNNQPDGTWYNEGAVECAWEQWEALQSQIDDLRNQLDLEVKSAAHPFAEPSREERLAILNDVLDDLNDEDIPF